MAVALHQVPVSILGRLHKEAVNWSRLSPIQVRHWKFVSLHKPYLDASALPTTPEAESARPISHRFLASLKSYRKVAALARPLKSAAQTCAESVFQRFNS